MSRSKIEKMAKFKAIEVCAGAGGQAIGLEVAGFEPVALIDNDENANITLKANRPAWPVQNQNLKTFEGRHYRGIDLLAGGLPCPPFSIAGLQKGEEDERDLFPAMLRLASEIRPKAVMIENVPGLMAVRFNDYRTRILDQLRSLGYLGEWKLLNACDFGVSQYRPRAILVVLQNELVDSFVWPTPNKQPPMSVGDKLYDLMDSRGWPGTDAWREKACSIAPTIVGGSLKHGGPDLGPTRAKKAWVALGVDGHGIADQPPGPDFVGKPRLTVRMVARLQGFPDNWEILGSKTAAYRQVGNAFPPPVAQAVASKIKRCLTLH